MINEFESIETVVNRLIENQKQDVAFPLLDFYYLRCKQLVEFEFIGRLALKHTYPDLAVKCAERTHALSTTPEELFISRSNLYKAYHAANEPAKALFYCKLNLDSNPNDFETLLSYSEYLKSNNQRKESEAIVEELKSRTDLTLEQRKSLWVADTYQTLKSGQTALGIQKYLHTDKDKTTIFDIKGMKRWNGVIMPGSKLYVNAEGGYGDEIINIRFFQHLRDLGMDPILYSNLERDDLYSVFRRNGFKVITQDYMIEKNVPWEYLMQLPIKLNVSEKDLWKGTYLSPKMNPKNYLGPKTEFRVGIKCSGNQYFARDTYRSIPIDQIIDSLPMNVEIYYLDTEKESRCAINLNNQIKSWDDTFDFISQMDLVVSSCTSVVHAAGSIGIPTIVYVPILEYYIWTSSRNDNSTPWYGDNFYVFRQSSPKSWSEPIESSKELINRIMNGIYTMEKI